MTDQKDHTNLHADDRFMTAVQNIMEQEWGRYFFRRMLETYGVRQSTFTGNALNSAYAQGFQEAGLLLEDLAETASAADFLKMLQENYDEQAIGDDTEPRRKFARRRQ